ncbi:proline-rich proteoglycan 2-like [Pantherophis guttatus]|uniref:Proline-rich proteoglycan 2-like n=1 Tax=Pantherophis guttatus TaxID=94885 RepID=A0ABM3ZQ43_PANGU|nr:proline-rich proteoglycan 2-like [Pantherophis guttatus]
MGPDVVPVRVLRATPPSPARQARGRGQQGARWGPGYRLPQGAARSVSGEGAKGGCLEGSREAKARGGHGPPAWPPTRLSRAPPAEGPPTRAPREAPRGLPGEGPAASAPGRQGQPTRGLQRDLPGAAASSDRPEAPPAETPPRPELPPQLPGPGEPQVRSPAPQGGGGDGRGLRGSPALPRLAPARRSRPAEAAALLAPEETSPGPPPASLAHAPPCSVSQATPRPSPLPRSSPPSPAPLPGQIGAGSLRPPPPQCPQALFRQLCRGGGGTV